MKNKVNNRFFDKKFNASYQHWNNINNKLNFNDLSKEQDDFLTLCVTQYLKYDRNFDVNDIVTMTQAWNNYLKFVRTNNKSKKTGKPLFSAQSKFEPSILEESIFRMFKCFVDETIKACSIKAYCNMYFAPLNFEQFKKDTTYRFNVKDQDFALYKDVEVSIGTIKQTIPVPIVAIECKTYLDKTMLEGSIATAEKIKNGNPYCYFCIVAECYDVGSEVDIKTTRIDQIYVLTKQKGRNKQSEIKEEVLEQLYIDVKNHLNCEWSDVEKKIKEKGVVI